MLAFHNVSADRLWGEEDYLDEDVLCVGGFRRGQGRGHRTGAGRHRTQGISAGKLRLARQLEPLTAVLISINRKYKVHSGIRITGLSIPGKSAPVRDDSSLRSRTPGSLRSLRRGRHGHGADRRARGLRPREPGRFAPVT